MRIDKLAVIGVGLIGASCALAARAASAVSRVVGIGRSRANLDRALARGAIDRGLLLDADWAREVADADLVLIAIPVAQYRGVLTTLVGNGLGERTVITDAGSTKQDVVLAARETLRGKLAQFVPGHPIAGSERSGAEAGDATLYADLAALVRRSAGHRVSILAGTPEILRAIKRRPTETHVVYNGAIECRLLTYDV